jgi:hypothetical protein
MPVFFHSELQQSFSWSRQAVGYFFVRNVFADFSELRWMCSENTGPCCLPDEMEQDSCVRGTERECFPTPVTDSGGKCRSGHDSLSI